MILLKISTRMCPGFFSGIHPKYPAEIPPWILALLISVIQEGISLGISAGAHTDIPLGISPDFLSPAFPLRTTP